jgi:hypothetical protein
MKTTMILLAAGFLLTGCFHDPFGPDFTPPSPPRGVTTSTGDGFIEVFWDENREPDVAGYHVYAASSYEGPYDLIGTVSSPYFVDYGVRNGYLYYYAIDAYDFAGNVSELSRDVAYDIPRPEGYNVVLSDYRVYPASSGYDFSTYSIVPYTDQYVDIYFENYNGTLYMNVRTDSDIQDMGLTSSIVDVREAPASGWSTTHDVLLAAGHTYVVWTWDDHYAKFRVTSLSSGRVVFDWAYQLVESNPLLKRDVGERKATAFEEKVR